MSDLIDTTEMYLRTVYELIEEGVPPMRARIAERLHQSGPTVSQTVSRMERDGLLHLDDERRIKLTDHGRSLAVAVMRKHRLAERLLIDVIGLDWQLVHDEACRWEHVISDAVEQRLVHLLPDTGESPYGNPIPGLAELGVDKGGHSFREDADPISELAPDVDPVDIELRRMSESVQADAGMLAELAAAGVFPGAHITVTRGGLGFVLAVDGYPPLEVSAHVADGLFGRAG